MRGFFRYKDLMLIHSLSELLSYINNDIKYILGVNFDIYLEDSKGDFLLLREGVLFYNPVKCEKGITLWNDSKFFDDLTLRNYPYNIVEYDYVYNKIR
jgi:hypothetical protein